MKKIICLALSLVIVIGCVGVFAMPDDEIYKADGSAFHVIYIPWEVEDQDDTIKARYADTKQPITLSDLYNGRLYATVPKENADRKIEAFKTTTIDFLDDDNSYFEFHPMQELSATGVIKGNEKGEAEPFANITRAEVTAMLLRFLGLEQIPMQGTVRIFDDVTSDKWYYREILSAYAYGLVKGDSETIFSPERNVSREEFTVMVERGVKYAGLGYPGDNNFNITDREKISDWAKEAYEMLGNYVVTDVEEPNSIAPKQTLNPQKSATRYEVANLLYEIAFHCQVYPSQIEFKK